MKKLNIQRRTFLRGLGTALALPVMESALPRSLWAAAAPTKSPLRMAFLFVPNGAHMPAWTPTVEGADFALPATLEPLAPFRDQLLVLSGLAHDTGFPHGDGAGDHARSAATFLTGVHPEKTDGKGIRAGISVDQIAAQELGVNTRFASLELGCEEGRLAGNCDNGYSCAYSNNISWRSPNQPAGKEVDPRQLFDRLFGAGSAVDQTQSRAKRDLERRSILDLVQQDARDLRRKLGADDSRKLDQYLEGVREIERRIEQPQGKLMTSAGIERPSGVPEDFSEHARLMGDLMVTAMQADLTRVASWMFANEGSGKSYPELGIKEGHHDLSHHQGLEEKQAKLAKINRYHMEQLAYVLERMRSTPDGDGTLLDNMALVYGGGIGDGNAHNHDDLPVILLGGAGGAFQGGRHLQFPKGTPLMNLYLNMLHTAGVQVEAVGDSTRLLPGLGAA